MNSVEGADHQSSVRSLSILTCQFVKGEHPEGLQRRERSSGFDELTAGEGGKIALDYVFSILSLGMMLFEVATGRPNFDMKSQWEVTKLLCDKDFEVN